MTARTRPAPPAWMLAEIADGIQRLIFIGFPGAPAMELMEGTVRAWGEALMMRNCIWDERLDAWRIREAFLRLSARAERWPAPTHLIDALPDRILPKLPEPEMSDEQRRANLRRISQIMTDALNQKKPPEGESR